MEPELKQLMKELGEAINETLAESRQIIEVVARVKAGGYDICITVEATIGVSKRGDPKRENISMVSTMDNDTVNE